MIPQLDQSFPIAKPEYLPLLSEVKGASVLYEQDFCLWIETNVQLLNNGQFNHVDWINIMAELESMGRSERTGLKSNLKILLMHLLKWLYQPNKRTNSWLFTIEEHRQRITEAIEDSPSLTSYYSEVFDKCYEKARELASKETGIAIQELPIISPFSPEQALNTDYLPEITNQQEPLNRA